MSMDRPTRVHAGRSSILFSYSTTETWYSYQIGCSATDLRPIMYYFQREFPFASRPVATACRAALFTKSVHAYSGSTSAAVGCAAAIFIYTHIPILCMKLIRRSPVSPGLSGQSWFGPLGGQSLSLSLSLSLGSSRGSGNQSPVNDDTRSHVTRSVYIHTTTSARMRHQPTWPWRHMLWRHARIVTSSTWMQRVITKKNARATFDAEIGKSQNASAPLQVISLRSYWSRVGTRQNAKPGGSAGRFAIGQF